MACVKCVANGPDFCSEIDLNWGIELRLVRYNNHMVGCNFDTGRTIKHCHGALRTTPSASVIVGKSPLSQRLGRRQAQKAHF